MIEKRYSLNRVFCSQRLLLVHVCSLLIVFSVLQKHFIH